MIAHQLETQSNNSTVPLDCIIMIYILCICFFFFQEKSRLQSDLQDIDQKWLALSVEYQRKQEQFAVERHELEEMLKANEAVSVELGHSNFARIRKNVHVIPFFFSFFFRFSIFGEL